MVGGGYFKVSSLSGGEITDNNGKGCTERTGMNHLAFIVQILQTFQNVFRQTQDSSGMSRGSES